MILTKKSLLLFFAFFTWIQILNAETDRVVILANANSKESLAVARYYAQKRGIPEDNIISLKMPNREVVKWQEYAQSIYNPLMDELIAKQWIQATPLGEQDVYGRNRYRVTANRITWMVTVYGVPLKISKSEHELHAPANIPTLLRTDAAAVDSELVLALIDGQSTIGPLNNPLFRNASPPPQLERSLIRIGRLDGASAADARALVDRALAGEANPVWGRAYVDVTGIHETGNQWMREVASRLQTARWDVAIRHSKGTFRGTDRFDAPFFYFGWYAEHINGPFVEKFIQFPPGAIAFHLHSFSASQLRNPSRNWCAGLIRKGATVTLGNVYEPTLGHSLHPHLFVEALLAGKSVGEAAWYAQPVLSWQGILIGDPLYKPNFGDAVDQPSSPEAKGYGMVRRLQGLQREGREQQAWTVGERFLQQTPHLPLAWTLATLSTPEKPTTQTLQLLRDSTTDAQLRTEQTGLILKIARYLQKHGDSQSSLRLYRWLADKVQWTQVSQKTILTEAVAVATQAENDSALDYFNSLLEPVVAPD